MKFKYLVFFHAELFYQSLVSKTIIHNFPSSTEVLLAFSSSLTKLTILLSIFPYANNLNAIYNNHNSYKSHWLYCYQCRKLTFLIYNYLNFLKYIQWKLTFSWVFENCIKVTQKTQMPTRLHILKSLCRCVQAPLLATVQTHTSYSSILSLVMMSWYCSLQWICIQCMIFFSILYSLYAFWFWNLPWNSCIVDFHARTAPPGFSGSHHLSGQK